MTMSSITLPTRGLVGLLEDAILTTADPKMELPHLTAVLLHTDHGDWDMTVDPDDATEGNAALIESVPSKLLVASSTNLAMIGQCHTPCSGTLRKPVLVSHLDAEAVIDVFKPLITKRLPKTVTHQSVITCSGETVIVSEDPNQVPGGVSVSLTALDVEPFPRNIADLMAPNPQRPVVVDGREVPPSYGTGLDGAHLTVLGKVAKRRCMPIAMYRHHQRSQIVVEIGAAYRAVVMPLPLREDEGQDEGPQVVVFRPDLPERKDSVVTEPMVPA
jgi:hypothetical protein